MRYLTDMFHSFFPNRSSNVTLNTTDHLDETTLNNTVLSKLDVSIANPNEKSKKFADDAEEFLRTPTLKHVNINEKRLSQEKQIFIENLKTCPSPYSSSRRAENKFNAKEQLPTDAKLNTNIYSEDPLSTANPPVSQDRNSLLYEYVDARHEPSSIPPTRTNEQEEVIYDVINTANERVTPAAEETEYDSVLYAIPKTNP